MKIRVYIFLFIIISLCTGIGEGYGIPIKLPEPRYDSDTSVEESLLKRRSLRNYRDKSLTVAQVSQLIWAAQGVTNKNGFRTAPSAGALYPLEVYIVCGDVEELAAGIYKYKSSGHELIKIAEGDRRKELCNAGFGQPCIKNAAIDIVFSAVYERTTVKYGKRGIKYVHMEAGHAAQNVCLQAIPLNLGIVTIGAFYDSKVKKVMQMPEKEEPLYILAVGKK
jgi:SagB-type dehydrogenase family enzyme